MIAEGVESDDQYDYLETLGCDLIQGYVISPPVSASSLGSMMAEASLDERLAA